MPEKITIESLFLNDLKIGSPPIICSMLNEALNNPNSSVNDIEKIVSTDQGLTARILRLANSPFYGLSSKVETVHHAVTILGTIQISDLALATSVIKMFDQIPKELIDIESFWTHSVACAVISRIIATYKKEFNVERFFVLGIMHDIGKLILFQKKPEIGLITIKKNRDEKIPLFIAEKETIGFDHCDIGAEMAIRWKLPIQLSESIQFHHRPLKALQFSENASIINFSDIIAHMLLYGESGEAFIPVIEQEVWDKIGLPESILPLIFNQAEKQIQSVIDIIVKN